ncbi:MAG: hypothetical protein QM752_08230 [Gammaproteobacteria bacterium]
MAEERDYDPERDLGPYVLQDELEKKRNTPPPPPAPPQNPPNPQPNKWETFLKQTKDVSAKTLSWVSSPLITGYTLFKTLPTVFCHFATDKSACQENVQIPTMIITALSSLMVARRIDKASQVGIALSNKKASDKKEVKISHSESLTTRYINAADKICQYAAPVVISGVSLAVIQGMSKESLIAFGVDSETATTASYVVTGGVTSLTFPALYALLGLNRPKNENVTAARPPSRAEEKSKPKVVSRHSVASRHSEREVQLSRASVSQTEDLPTEIDHSQHIDAEAENQTFPTIAPTRDLTIHTSPSMESNMSQPQPTPTSPQSKHPPPSPAPLRPSASQESQSTPTPRLPKGFSYIPEGNENIDENDDQKEGKRMGSNNGSLP